MLKPRFKYSERDKGWVAKFCDLLATVIEAKCGLCNNEYDIVIQRGEMKLLECTECHNTTLQMIRG